MKYLDLHLHLDGAITPEIARKLSIMQNLPIQSDLDGKLILSGECKSLSEFLNYFSYPLSLLQTKEGMREAVKLVMADEKENGAVYAEIRFAPQFHTERGMTQEDAVLSAIDGMNESPIPGGLILCLMRGESDKLNRETLRVAEKYFGHGVLAIDLAGDELCYPVKHYRDYFKEAKALGIPFTVHAGEAAGTENVRDAVMLGASRIGHGVRMDDETAKLCRDKNITVEMCPTSNRMTHAWEDMETYPLRKFMSAGVSVTVNTDDPGIENTNIEKEFRYIKELLKLTDAEILELRKNAVSGAFCDSETKLKLMREIEKEGKYNG